MPKKWGKLIDRYKNNTTGPPKDKNLRIWQYIKANICTSAVKCTKFEQGTPDNGNILISIKC